MYLYVSETTKERKMKTSETIVKIAGAVLKAQKQMEGAKKDSANPFFKSKYADYGAVLEACKSALNDNGITILQPHISQVCGESVSDYVETILLHESGEFLSSQTPIICAKKSDPQALGSAITYARRYSLQSLVALPAEDDDGEKGMARGTAKPAPKGGAPNRATGGAPKKPTKPKPKL